MLEPDKILQQRYKLKEILAQNAGRQTWLAEDISIEPAETVILKFLSFGENFQWQGLKLFEREADILKQLSHPRIPKYRDYFALEDRIHWFALVEEYIPGKSLKQLVENKKRFTEEELRIIASEVLDILCYLHTLNPQVIHRDIKPSNLIIGEDNKVNLIDFGAVQDSVAAQGATFTVVGTYGYAPIEQFGGRTVPASDLYALGATLIHLATGIIPANLPQTKMRIQFQDKVSLSSGFINWIVKLTEPDIQQRFSDATLALNSLKSGINVNSSHSISKPHGSRIQLQNSQNKLEIDIPSQTMMLIRIVLIVLDILIILSILLVLLVEPIAGLISLVIISAAQLFMIRMIGRNYIQFDRDKFEIQWKIFGFTYRRQIGETSAIHKVALKTISSSVEYEPQKMILMQAGAKNYGFAGVLTNLTNIEKGWLIREINDWLKFPTIIENKQTDEQDTLQSLPPIIRKWVEKSIQADIKDRLTASKPSKSKIDLNQSYEQLEIKLPSRGIRFSHLPFIFTCIILFSSAAPIVLSDPAIAIVLFIFGFLILSMVLLPAFIGLDIKFDRDNFTLQRNIFGFAFGKKIEKTSTIHDVIRDESSISVNNKRLEMVTIKCGVIKHSFGSFAPQLTPGELNWLVKEMKNWLGIKIE